MVFRMAQDYFAAEANRTRLLLWLEMLDMKLWEELTLLCPHICSRSLKDIVFYTNKSLIGTHIRPQ